MDAGPDFPHFGLGRRLLYIRRDLAPLATAIFAALGRPPDRPGAGNRGSGYVLNLPGGVELFARWGRRGGMARLLTRDLYFGTSARPLRELLVSNEARLRGIPIAEPLGVLIEAIPPCLYRSAFLTRPLAGANLWDFMRSADDPTARRRVVESVRAAVDSMHAAGLLHADLNLWNIFVVRAEGAPGVAIIDLDKARLYDGPVPAERRRANFARLARSIRKLDPEGRLIDRTSAVILTAF